MGINIKIPSYLQPYTEDSEVVEVNGGTVKECLDHLVKQYPDMKKMLFAKEGKLLDYVSIYVDGEFTYTDELARPVKDVDELQIVYVIGGG